MQPLLNKVHASAIVTLGACLGHSHSLAPLSRALHAASYVAASAAEPAPVVDPILVTINGKQVFAAPGSTIMDACHQAGISVPTLCSHPRLPKAGGKCMVCMCETNKGGMKPACSTPVQAGLVVETDTPKVRTGVRGLLALMQSNHPADCLTCDANGRCEFQELSSRYHVKAMLPPRVNGYKFGAEAYEPQREVLQNASIRLDLDKCVKCERCVSACRTTQEMDVLGMSGKGTERHPGVTGDALDLSRCIECGQCSAVCPVGAISEQSAWRQVLDQLESKRKVMMIMMAPSIRVAIGEELGLAPGAVTTGQIATAQRMLGFDYVFDANFSADLTIMEEGTELLRRLCKAWGLDLTPAHTGDAAEHAAHEEGPLPMFTSCCPAWINLVEKSHPELIPHLSTCKSPMGMLGAVVKRYMGAKLGLKREDVCLVGVFPCTAKKGEAARGELQREGEAGPDVDMVLTTREFGHILRAKSIPLGSLPESQFDDPLAEASGAGALFGNTGGVMEAALRTAYEVATGQALPRLEVDAVRGLEGIKDARIRLPDSAPAGVAGRELRVAVASGIANAKRLLERMKAGEVQYDFLEVMSCPGGCVNGGGQPKSRDPLAVQKRAAAIYSIDEKASVRKSHENPSIQRIYQEFLGEPGSHLSHELLHTTYTDRSAQVLPCYVPPPSHAHQQPGPLPRHDLDLVAATAKASLSQGS